MKSILVTITDEAALERIARFAGEDSEARRALNDIARRRECGENPVAVQHRESIMVVPRAHLTPTLASNVLALFSEERNDA